MFVGCYHSALEAKVKQFASASASCSVAVFGGALVTWPQENDNCLCYTMHYEHFKQVVRVFVICGPASDDLNWRSIYGAIGKESCALSRISYTVCRYTFQGPLVRAIGKSVSINGEHRGCNVKI